MQSFPCKVFPALMGSPNSLVVPRAEVEITRTGLAVGGSQLASSRAGCSSAAALPLHNCCCGFIPFPAVPFPSPDWEDAPGKGQDLLNCGSAAGQGLNPASARSRNYIYLYLQKSGLTQQNNRWESENASKSCSQSEIILIFFSMMVPASTNTSWLPGWGLAEEKLPELLPVFPLALEHGGMFVLEELHHWEGSPWSASL